MKPVILHPLAKDELVDASAFYEKRRNGLGLELRTAVRSASRAIQREPQLYPLHNRDTRKTVLHRFPYSVFYIERRDAIWIVAIAHQSRQPGYWENRTVP